MFFEVTALVHPIESSKPAARVKGIRLIVQLKVIRLVEGRLCLASITINNWWRDKALHDKKIAGDFVLISAMSVGGLCRLDEESSRGARRLLRPTMAWEYDPGDYSGQSCTVGVAIRRTRLTRCASPMFCFIVFSCDPLDDFFGVLPRGENSAHREIKCCYP